MPRSSFLRNAGPTALSFVNGKREGHEFPVKSYGVKVTVREACEQDVEIVKRRPRKLAVTHPADIPKRYAGDVAPLVRHDSAARPNSTEHADGHRAMKPPAG